MSKKTRRRWNAIVSTLLVCVLAVCTMAAWTFAPRAIATETIADLLPTMEAETTITVTCPTPAPPEGYVWVDVGDSGEWAPPVAPTLPPSCKYSTAKTDIETLARLVARSWEGVTISTVEDAHRMMMVCVNRNGGKIPQADDTDATMYTSTDIRYTAWHYDTAKAFVMGDWACVEGVTTHFRVEGGTIIFW